jgi:RNA polymerase sigma-70 factor (ECF subfamily)
MTLMSAAADAEPEDVEAVLLDATPRLLAIAVAIVGDRHDAEEALQDALVAAWRSWAALRDPAARAAWLTRICVRRCIRQRGLLRRRAVRETPAVEARHAASEDQEDVLWDGALALLSRRQRAVVSLHYYHGYALDECATLLGCRPGSVRQHLARALRRLRETVDA